MPAPPPASQSWQWQSSGPPVDLWNEEQYEQPAQQWSGNANQGQDLRREQKQPAVPDPSIRASNETSSLPS